MCFLDAGKTCVIFDMYDFKAFRYTKCVESVLERLAAPTFTDRLTSEWSFSNRLSNTVETYFWFERRDMELEWSALRIVCRKRTIHPFDVRWTMYDTIRSNRMIRMYCSWID